VKHHIENRIFHIEILTPKQDSAAIESDLDKFAEKYTAVVDAGYIACITDNPMGLLSFQATDILPELGLPVKAEQLMIHLNTFHTKDDLDEILNTAVKIGARYLLVVSGDGSERMPRLKPESIGETCNTVTSVELLRYIRRTHPGAFHLGVAFNPYEPQDHEMEKMRRKVDAGAEFICTQPVIGYNEHAAAVRAFGLPVIMDAWMSRKLHLLSACVGYTIPEEAPYDPIANLKELQTCYPDCGLYLALLGFKTQFPLLKDLWKQTEEQLP